MRFSRLFTSVFFLVATFLSCASAEIKIKVIDPQDAVVAGAQVQLLRPGTASIAAVQTTSAEGLATFRGASGSYRVQVLAPGFAVATGDVTATIETTIRLQVASAAETVAVTATRTLVPEQETASSVSLLNSGEIEAMQPTSLADALRFLPGAVVNVAGQRGGFGSIFVDGGDSRYNKVLVDGVPVNDPGGTFNFSTIPVAETDRIEFLHSAQSTLYGSDAMTSVVQLFSRDGTTATPELRFGADGGSFGTAHGFVALSGTRSIFDYDAFADQFNTNGQGPNANYTNALQGGNVGVQLSQRILLRIRTRHSNSRTGVPGEWDFNNQRLLAPDIDQRARANNLIGDAELSISGPSHWQHRLTGYDYNSRRLNQDTLSDQSCSAPPFDCPFLATAHLNRAGFMYQGDYMPSSWAQTTVGYEFEDENGRFYTSSSFPPPTFNAGLRLSHAVYAQQRVTWKRLTALAGVRYAREDAWGRTGNPPLPPEPSIAAPGINKAVPRVALTFLALKGGDVFSGTRLHFSYAQGIKEARFEEEYAGPPYSIPNANLQPEQNRAFETGIEQHLLGGKFVLSGMYFNNEFHNQISYVIVNQQTFVGQYQNVDKSIAHGAEVRFAGRLNSRVSLTSSYTYTSSQYLTGSSEGQSLLRRPKHAGSLLATYLGKKRWGANLGGSFVGRRPDNDFLGFQIYHAAGYARVDVGGWYAINSRITAYANVENALNAHYNEVVGYPALTANFRAGIRFRIGGE